MISLSTPFKNPGTQVKIIKMNTFIFDIGNVLLDYSPIKMVRRVVHDHPDAEYLADTLFSRYYWKRLDLDEITIEDEKKDLKNVLPSHLYELGCHILDKWLEEITPIGGIHEVLSFLKEKGCKLYYLSNICSQFILEGPKYDHIKSLLDYFDGGVISGPLHLVKPDKEIYEHLFNKYNIDPQDALYIDDNENNIKAGKVVGLNTYLFDGDAYKLEDYISNIM